MSRSLPQVLFVDNFDSFTFNLVEAFERLGCDVRVFRNDVPAGFLTELAERSTGPVLFCLSPGPGRPEKAGSCLELIRRARARFPVFGVCLGHQALLQEAGAEVEAANEIVHGKASAIEHDGASLLAGLPSPLRVGRYHSLCVRNVPTRFTVHARLGTMAMAVSDEEALQFGVQFHPESLLTPQGDLILSNVLERAAGPATCAS